MTTFPPTGARLSVGDRLGAVRQSHFREQREQGALFLRVEVGEQAGGVESRAERLPQFVPALRQGQGALAAVGGMGLPGTNPVA